MFSSDGRTADGFMFGIYLVITATTISHVHAAINIRDWNIMYSLIYLKSLVWLLLILYFADGYPNHTIYRSTFSYVLAQPGVWITFTFVIITCTLPLYGIKQIRALFI